MESIKSILSVIIPYHRIKGKESYEELKEKILYNTRLKLFITIVYIVSTPLVSLFLKINARIWEAEIFMFLMLIAVTVTFPIVKNGLFKTHKSLSNFYLVHLVIDVFCFSLTFPFLGFMVFLYVVITYWIFVGNYIFPDYWRSLCMFLGTFFAVTFNHFMVYLGWIEVLPLVAGQSVAYLRDINYFIAITITLFIVYYYATVWFALFWHSIESKNKKLEEIKDELEIERNTLEEKVKLRTMELNKERMSLEQKVADRTKELNQRASDSEKLTAKYFKKNKDLERFKKLTVARELKMIELKNELKRIKSKDVLKTV